MTITALSMDESGIKTVIISPVDRTQPLVQAVDISTCFVHRALTFRFTIRLILDLLHTSRSCLSPCVTLDPLLHSARNISSTQSGRNPLKTSDYELFRNNGIRSSNRQASHTRQVCIYYAILFEYVSRDTVSKPNSKWDCSYSVKGFLTIRS
jgi:hypothetical protein